jgi:PAS domain S-box-containing protein
MLTVLYACLTQQHDLRLVLVAGILCIFACFTAVDLFLRARDGSGRRRFALLSGAAAIFEAGVWATHFVAELAFEPGLPVAYDARLTALSLVIAVALAWPGLALAARSETLFFGGAVIGIAIGAMHYVGMAALRVPADLRWNLPLVGLSLTLGVALSSAAVWAAMLGSGWRHRLAATLFFVAAILALHFFGMAAVTLIPDPLIRMPGDTAPAGFLALGVAAVTLGFVMFGMSVSIIDQQSGRLAAREAERLRRREAHLALAQRVAATGSFELDLRTRAIVWSDETYRIFGVDPEIGPLNQNILEELVLPEDRQRLRDQIAAAASTGRSEPACEYRIRRHDGSLRILHREMELACDAAGRPEKLVGVVRDVTELRDAERRNEELQRELLNAREVEADQLRRSREHLARILRISGVGCIERDLPSERVEWSAEACRIFGIEQDVTETTRTGLYNMIHPDDRATVRAAVERSNAGIPSPPLEYRIVRPDGEVRYVYRENDLLFDDSGRPVRRISTLKDVTEIRAAQQREKELERQLMHAQKLQALGTLAGGVAHDLNNMLVPILALSQLALDELPEDSPVRADIETIARAGESARDLVRRILSFSRRQDFVGEAVDLAEVTREALQMLRASLPATIRFVVRIDAVPKLRGDAGALQQLVVNLVTNAAQAIGAPLGEITVRVWSPARGGTAANGRATAVCLSVADTGCGMDLATLDRVFEPFFTTKPVGEGTGLGLAIVHGIVARHGGHIEARSQPGEGSEFTVTLPALAEPQVAPTYETMAA